MYLSVPSVLGDSVGLAERQLYDAGFPMDTISVNATACTGPSGVFAQNPGGGSRVVAGTRISLSAMAADCYRYPDEIGADPTRAAAALRAIGFTDVTVTPECEYGMYPVEQQSPASTDQYLLGSTPITLRSLCVPG